MMSSLQKHVLAALAALVVAAAAGPAHAALVGYWKFDGDALDSSLSGFHGTVVGGAPFASGYAGQAIDLSGSAQYVSTVPAQTLGLGGNFTASAWIYADATNGTRTIFGTNTTSSTNLGLHLAVRDGKAYLGFYGNDTGGAATLATGQWYHVAYQFDGGRQRIFVNGALDVVTAGHAAFAGTDVVDIGRALGGNYFDGRIDEVTVFNQTLSLNQVQHLAAGGNPAALPAADPSVFTGGTPSGPVILGPTLANGKRNAYQLVAAKELTWDQARVDAMNHTYMGVQGHLVTMENYVENTFANAFGSGDRWMGFTDSNAVSQIDGATLPGGGSATNQFRWVNGQPVTYTNWNSGEPNNSGGEDAGILTGTGKWNDHRAGATLGQTDHYLTQYVIEYEVGAAGSATGLRILPRLGPVDPNTGTRNAYELIGNPSTWVAAKVDAQNRQHEGAQGHLATIGSAAEQTFVQTFGNAWIGLTDDPNHAPGAFEGGNQNGLPTPPTGTLPVSGEKGYGWAWVTGEPLYYQNWNNPGEPNGGTAENYGEMRADGLWNDLSNTGPRDYIVEYNVARQAVPAFQARMVQLGAGAPDVQFNGAGEALSVLSGFGVGSQYNVAVNASNTPLEVNYASGGNFPLDNPYPNGLTDPGEHFAVRATSKVFIPEGEWSIAFAGDDGGYLRLDNVRFINQINTNGDLKSNDGNLLWEAAGSHGATIGHFTVPAGGMTTTLDAMTFEAAGGQHFEISIAPGHWPGFNAQAFGLLVDGQFGWTATPTPPPANGFNVRMIQLDPANPSGFNVDIDSAPEAVAIALGVNGTGDFNVGGQAYRVTTFVQTTAPYIDFGGSTGSFHEPTLYYPDGRASPGDDFLVGAQAFMRLPAGTYTIAAAGDDGKALQLMDALGGTFSFTQEIGSSADPTLNGTLMVSSTATTMGVFTVGEGTVLELNALFYERAGGDSFEISLAKGAFTSFNTTDFFILRNGVFPGLLVAPDLLSVVPEPSTFALFGLGAVGLALAGRRWRKGGRPA